RRGCVADIAKTLAPDDTDGENLGIVKFGAAGARLLTGMLDERVSAGHLRDWAPSAFGDFARRRPLHVIGTRGYPWTEIDFPEDFERAVREVLPAIEGEDAILTVDRRRNSNATVIVQPDATIVVRRVRYRPD